MKHIKIALISIILISLIFYVFSLRSSLLPSNQIKTVTDSVEPKILTELSDAEYDQVLSELIILEKEKDPKASLERLREIIKTNEAVLRECHSIAHELGHEAYHKYGDFGEAMKYQDEICNSAYLHGIIESHFAASEDPLQDMKVICSDYFLGSFISWECYHGIGHGIMFYTENDLPKSLEICNSLDSSFGRTNCTNGVFMENFNVDQKNHVSNYLKTDDLFYPCGSQASTNKSHCYLYAPTHYLSINKNDYLGALKWCDSAETGYIQVCVQGVGSQAIKENINDPKYVEDVCMIDPKKTVSCIRGMIGLYINHYGDLEPAKELCNKLEDSNKKTCENMTLVNESLFKN